MKLLTYLSVWVCGLLTGMGVCLAISAARYPHPLLDMPPSHTETRMLGLFLFGAIAMSAVIIAGLIRDEIP